MSRSLKRSRGGFTLLELLVVIAILAVIAGGLLVAYNGLEDAAKSGHDAYNSAGVDRAVRTYKVINREYANPLDSLSDSTGGAGVMLDRLDTGLSGRLSMSVIVPAELTALANVGITSVLDIDITIYNTGGDSDFTNDRGAGWASPVNRIFDDSLLLTGGAGVPRAIGVSPDNDVAIVDPVTGLDLLTKLGLTNLTRVFAFGLGSSCTMIDPTGQTNGALAYAPYSRVPPNRYGYFILLFQVTDLAGVPLTGDAVFVGVLDPTGRLSEEAYTDYLDDN